ncbi:MAG: hypothetical protein DRI34_06715 [Deltaproteobacteria bacterium]|nr:MAG: hypothetical protein DRI34_06715 [Deltaproteobacteria bacterium]
MIDCTKMRAAARRILLENLRGKASALLLERLQKRLESCPPEDAEIRKCFRNIAVSVTMFVDEELGRELEKKLLALCDY